MQPRVVEIGNQFYSPNSNENDKVVVCSMISSARPEPTQALTNAVQAPATVLLSEPITNATMNYVPLRFKPTSHFDVPPHYNSGGASIQPSGLNTAIKASPFSIVPLSDQTPPANVSPN